MASLAVAIGLLGISSTAQARIPAENRLAAEAFQAAVRGEREFGTDFIAKVPTDDERAYLMNFGSCNPGGLEEGNSNSVRITWSCNIDGRRFQKYVILQMEGGRIAKIGVFDCFNRDRQRRCI